LNAVFADTSAFLALVNKNDLSHSRAAAAFAALTARRVPLITTSFVMVETYALLARRFGLEAVRSFRADLAPLLDVVWVDEPLHNAGLDLLLAAQRRAVSLVDAVSFVTMQQKHLSEAFAFDPHFEQEGFTLVR
jgi:predicted nucleic acid-binding protein